MGVGSPFVRFGVGSFDCQMQASRQPGAELDRVCSNGSGCRALLASRKLTSPMQQQTSTLVFATEF